MTTIFVIKGVDFIDLNNRIRPVEQTTGKTRFDVLQPGRVMATTNAGGVIRVMQRGAIYYPNGNPYNRECGKPCFWCRHPFDGLAMPIPIRAAVRHGILTIWGDGIFCSYACAYASLLKELDVIPAKRDPNYANSKTLLLQCFEQEFPREKLVAARDWRLLKDVGNGDMSLKEWQIGLVGIRLVQNANIIFNPVTISYDLIKDRV